MQISLLLYYFRASSCASKSSSSPKPRIHVYRNIVYGSDLFCLGVIEKKRRNGQVAFGSMVIIIDKNPFGVLIN